MRYAQTGQMICRIKCPVSVFMQSLQTYKVGPPTALEEKLMLLDKEEAHNQQEWEEGCS